MPKISVIVPVYNVEKYLDECINSILSQTFTEFELILINDGSTDMSGKICDDYMKLDSRIRVYHQSNQGQAAARNFGVKQAEADWIHFVDGDDVINPRMLETLYDMVLTSKAKISVCSVIEDYEVLNNFFSSICIASNIVAIDEETMINLYTKDPYMYWIVCGKLIKKEIVLKYPFTCGRIYEDNAVVCKWLYEAKQIVVTNEKLYFYRKNPNSTTKKEFTLKQCDFLWALQEQIEFFKKTGYKNLLAMITQRYLSDYMRYYKKLLLICKDKKVALKLRKRSLLFVAKNTGSFLKNRYDLLAVFYTFFPKQYSWLIKIKDYAKR